MISSMRSSSLIDPFPSEVCECFSQLCPALKEPCLRSTRRYAERGSYLFVRVPFDIMHQENRWVFLAQCVDRGPKSDFEVRLGFASDRSDCRCCLDRCLAGA